MPDYESKQVATWALGLAAALAVLGVYVAVAGAPSGAQVVAAGSGIVLVALLLANFAVLTVRVTDAEVRWFFGRGPVGRRIPMSRVHGAEVRRSAWYWGWGIRWTPRGWLWRSSGLTAVWLELEGGRRVGVGTSDPEGLARAIRARLPGGAEESPGAPGPSGAE